MTRARPLLLLVAIAAACGGDAREARDGDAREGDPSHAAATPSAERPRLSEARDGIWLHADGEPARRVTALHVAGFDYDGLAALQREGDVILYWAAAPVLSPDGRRVAYATNREAVAGGARGQSLWLLDLGDGSERALLARPNRSFRPVGWLGDAVVVYIGDEPGVHALDVGTGDRRLLASGTFVAAADDGGALLVADGVPDEVTLRLLRADGSTTAVPPPPPPFEYLAQAAFSSDGDTLVIQAAADSGFARRSVRVAVDGLR